MPGFSVDIGANTLQLKKSLAELREDLKQLKKQLDTTTDAATVTRLNQAISQTDRQIKTISGAQNIKAIGRDMKELPPAFNQAGFAVGNFSRVVQDAPFALLSGNLIAVSNNIDPLIQSFVQLKQQSGSGMAALRALGSSLMGTGGVLLGFSLVNAAITYFSARSMYAKEKAKDLSDTIRDVAKVERDATASVAGQIAQVTALANVVANTNKTYQERTRALTELRDVNKSYFGDLTLEDAATGKLTKTINEYSQAIINAAIVKEFSQEIAKVAKAASDAEADLEKRTNKVTQLNKAFFEARLHGTPTGREGTARSHEELEAEEKLGVAINEQRAAREKLLDLETEEALLRSRMNKVIEDGLKIKSLDNGKTGEDVDLLKQRIEALKQLQSEAGLTNEQQILLVGLQIELASRDNDKIGFTKEELRQRIDAILEGAFPVKTFEFKISPSIKIERAEVSNDVDISKSLGLEDIDLSTWDALVEKMKAASEAKKELLDTEKEKNMADFITGTLGPAFTDLFSDIATDGASAIEQFGQAVVDIIKRLLAAAAAAAVLSAILTAIFPGAGKGVTGFKAIFGQLSGFKFAQGGIVTGPTIGMIGEMNRPEAILPLDRLPQILGQLNNGNGNERLEAFVKGDGLLFVLDRAAKKQGRIL